MGCSCSQPVHQTAPTQESKNVVITLPNNGTIRSVYKLGPGIGSGSFGQVRSCTCRKSEKEYACKIMTKVRSIATVTTSLTEVFKQKKISPQSSWCGLRWNVSERNRDFKIQQ